MSKKQVEGYALKNPFYSPDGTKRPPQVPAQVLVKRERIEITNACAGKPGYSKVKTLERRTFASGVVKSRPFPNVEPARIQKGGTVGTTVSEIPLEASAGD